MKFFFLIYILFSCGSITAASTNCVEVGDEVHVHAKNGLKLRSEADEAGKVLTTLPYGTKVIVLSLSSNRTTVKDFDGLPIEDIWYEVSYNGKRGYVFAGYLSPLPVVPINKDFYDLARYADTLLHPTDTLVFQESHPRNSPSHPCDYTIVYEEGVAFSINSCESLCTTPRYSFQCADLSVVASIVRMCFENIGETYKVTYKKNQGQIIFSYDVTSFIIQKTSTGAVTVEIHACS